MYMEHRLLLAQEALPAGLAAEAVEPRGVRAVARLIEYARGRSFALPPHTTVELLEHPAIVPVPGAAYYAYGIMSWQGQHLPVLDFDALVRAYPGSNHAVAPRYALVVAYQGTPRGPIAHGAFGLAALPQIIDVGDESQCDLPADSDLWPGLALSCFRHEGQAVPILDTARVFAPYHG